MKSNLAVLMAQKKCRYISHISKETGISRTTLTNLYFDQATGIEFKTLETLCKYFNCGIGDLLIEEQ